MHQRIGIFKSISDLLCASIQKCQLAVSSAILPSPLNNPHKNIEKTVTQSKSGWMHLLNTLEEKISLQHAFHRYEIHLLYAETLRRLFIAYKHRFHSFISRQRGGATGGKQAKKAMYGMWRVSCDWLTKYFCQLEIIWLVVCVHSCE